MGSCGGHKGGMSHLRCWFLLFFIVWEIIYTLDQHLLSKVFSKLLRYIYCICNLMYFRRTRAKCLWVERYKRKHFPPTEESSDNSSSVLLDFQGKHLHFKDGKNVNSAINCTPFSHSKMLLFVKLVSSIGSSCLFRWKQQPKFSVRLVPA